MGCITSDIRREKRMSILHTLNGLVCLATPKKAKEIPAIKLINKGYIREDLSTQTNGPYRWTFEINKELLTIIYNKKSTYAPWSAFINNKEQYTGSDTGIIQRYPYVYNYIENV
jgi:hypothetical protein